MLSTRQGMFSRRTFLECGCGSAAGAAIGLMLSTTPRASAGKKTDLTPDEALALLKQGNKEFAADRPLHGPHDRRRRSEVAQAQTPFAVIVACSDSRAPPELLFDRGLGELFVVRDAGNVLDTVGLGSIQYAVAELGTPLVVVLGHQNCGAVRAAVEVVEHNAAFPGSIGQMLEPIIPAVLQARSREGDLVENAVRENVRRTVMRLQGSAEPILLEPLQAGRLKIVGARYGLETGEVDFFMES
jgi:carbonic anhydrase